MSKVSFSQLAEQEAKLQRQRRTSSIASTLIALLVIALIMVILGFILLPSLEQNETKLVTYAIDTVEEPEIEKKKISTSVSNPSPPSAQTAKAITANVQSPVSIPVPEVDVPEPSVEFGISDDFGEMGWDETGTGTSGSLFGRQVTSKNLGVVLDVSGSAHKHLDKAIAEIDKNFPTAHIILVVGCGMSDGKAAIGGGGGKVPGKPRVVSYKDLDSEKEYNSLKRSVPGQLEDFFRKIGEERSKELRQYFKQRDNLYALYGGDIHGTNFAFDFLLDIRVDTIYWFADFADRIDTETIEDLTKKLQRRGVMVISHNFLGKPVRKQAAEMTEKTGGETIEVVPGDT